MGGGGPGAELSSTGVEGREGVVDPLEDGEAVSSQDSAMGVLVGFFVEVEDMVRFFKEDSKPEGC